MYYRVVDDNSRALHVDGKGIIAEDTVTSVDFKNFGRRLFSQVKKQLVWSNRKSTPFISAYCDWISAKCEAERHVRVGKKDVRIIVIDMRKRDPRVRTEYRDARLLAKNLGLWIPKLAYHNSEYEYLFRHRIPNRVIVDCIKLDY